ncbi:MAG: metallophosphoesterase family protein, partial [Actinomycetota bacterium]
VLRVPPFGSIAARTHRAPLRLTATLTEVDPQALARDLASEERRTALVDEMAEGLSDAARSVAVRLALAGLLVGGAIAGLLPGRHLRGVLIGGAAGLLATSALLFATSRRYDIAAFQEPSFAGTLERAPEILAAVQKEGTSLAEIRTMYQIAADRLAEIVSLAGAPNHNPRTGTVALLHVSDIHSNPLGVEFAKQLADRFEVDAVIDTGDLTSFGQPIETRVGELVAGVGRPWLFVPGNHDSPEVRASIARVPNVVVLDKTVHTVGDLTILGWGDPTFTPGSLLSNEQARGRQFAEAPAVSARLEQEPPDVLAVHNEELALTSTGRVPIVLSGHGHRERQRTVNGTLELAVGSTGATGLGSFLVRSDLAYEAEVVYFRDRRAVALDYIRFQTLGGDFEIKRRTLEPTVPQPPATQQAPGPAPTPSPGGSPAPDPAPVPPVPTVPEPTTSPSPRRRLARPPRRFSGSVRAAAPCRPPGGNGRRRRSGELRRRGAHPLRRSTCTADRPRPARGARPPTACPARSSLGNPNLSGPPPRTHQTVFRVLMGGASRSIAFAGMRGPRRTRRSAARRRSTSPGLSVGGDPGLAHRLRIRENALLVRPEFRS